MQEHNLNRDEPASEDALPPAQREVVVLRLWSGMTLAEIAEVTGSSVSGVFALYRTALAAVRNAAIAAARSGARRRRREHGAAGAGNGGGWFQPAPEDAVDAAAAESALVSLPPAQREVVVLRLWSGMTLAEIAEVTGSSVSGVFAQYRAALAAVRRTMGAESSCRNL